jgi:hypothetical protein
MQVEHVLGIQELGFPDEQGTASRY